jgi:hypothetical protein
MEIPKQAAVGVGMMILGTLLFIPSLTIGVGTLTLASLFVAALLLTAGTYLFGVSGEGRPV